MLQISKMGVKRILYCDIDIRWINLIMCWTIVVSALCVSADQSFKNATTTPNTSPLHCMGVRNLLQRDRAYGNIPREPIPAKHLKVCASPEEASTSETCCTARMENTFAARAREVFDKELKKRLSGTQATSLRERATKFDEYFLELLETSKREFHEMFKKTYGVIYEQHSYVFTELFQDLKRYYERGRVRLDHAMESFFGRLYQKMFTVLNGQYHFDEKYLDCVGDHMKELKPFGDVPHKLAVQVKRSFVATRTFVQALQTAADVVAKMEGVPLPQDCGHALTRMKYCNLCKSKINVDACPGLCTNVMHGCLAYHSELNTVWNLFVDAFVNVAGRLLGPFNIEVVVEPLNIKISEAIMNFQENGHEVSQKVFSGCGRPRLGKRSNVATELHFETLQFGRNNRNRGMAHIDPTALERLIGDASYKVNSTRNFWSLLPQQICNDEYRPREENKNSCWNGEQMAKYTKPVVTGTGVAAMSSNPEVKVNHLESSRAKSMINEQTYQLRLMTSMLRSAYNGKDVLWEDDEDETEDTVLEGSGSGSGDFSTTSPGKGRNHGDPGPEDLEPDNSEGSGDYEDHHTTEPPPPRVHQDHHPPSQLPPKSSFPLPPSSPGSPSTTSAALPPLRAPLSRLEVTRAVAAYLFPIVVVWFQGIFNEW